MDKKECFAGVLCMGLLWAAFPAQAGAQEQDAPPCKLVVRNLVKGKSATVFLRTNGKAAPVQLGYGRADSRQDGTAAPALADEAHQLVAGGYRKKGTASWYGGRFHGRRTSSGEVYNMHGDTAAHGRLPLGTRLLVRNLENGRTAVVRVNDRMGARRHIIDLSWGTAKRLGFLHKGIARVELVELAPDEQGKFLKNGQRTTGPEKSKRVRQSRAQGKKAVVKNSAAQKARVKKPTTTSKRSVAKGKKR